MLVPASAVEGPVFVTETSADAWTVVGSVALLFAAFGSDVLLLKTPAVFERTVASATFELTWTVIVQTTDAPETRLLGAHETVPSEFVHAADELTLTVSAGSMSRNVKPALS